VTDFNVKRLLLEQNLLKSLPSGGKNADNILLFFFMIKSALRYLNDHGVVDNSHNESLNFPYIETYHNNAYKKGVNEPHTEQK